MSKKGLFLFLLPCFVMLASCSNEVERTVEEDTLDREAYLKANGIEQAPRESGLYFISTKEGTRFPAIEGEYIIFSYVMKTVNGEELWRSDNFHLDVSAPYLIEGILEGISLMKEGGEATFIIPPELAYGSDGVEDKIDPNMTLIFDIVIKEVRGPEEEAIRLQEYIDANEIDIEPTESGMYFIPVDSGNGIPVEKLDDVKVVYKGYTLDGTVFDENTASSYFLYTYGSTSVISGFKEGIGMMNHEGKATLILPYDLAYGVSGSNAIYPYSALIFEIELID